MFTLMKFISKQYQENFMLNASADVWNWKVMQKFNDKNFKISAKFF
jgi:hypothetical protein